MKRVLKVKPELQIHAFRDREVFLNRSLRVYNPRAGHDVTSGVARCECRRGCKTINGQYGIFLRLVKAVTANQISQPKLRHCDVTARQVRHHVTDGCEGCW